MKRKEKKRGNIMNMVMVQLSKLQILAEFRQTRCTIVQKKSFLFFFFFWINFSFFLLFAETGR